MVGRQRGVERGADRGRAIVADLARELREARLDRGLSQAFVGRAAGLSAAQVSRIERGMAPSMSIERTARLLAVVGLELSARAYPGASPLRDDGHAALLARFRARLHRSLRWRAEVPIPLPGDARAWDAIVAGDTWRLGVEAETRPRDAQALVRRISLKQRDGAVDAVVLVVADTRHGRSFVRAAEGDLAARFPASRRRALELLAAGFGPENDALILL